MNRVVLYHTIKIMLLKYPFDKAMREAIAKDISTFIGDLPDGKQRKTKKRPSNNTRTS